MPKLVFCLFMCACYLLLPPKKSLLATNTASCFHHLIWVDSEGHIWLLDKNKGPKKHVHNDSPKIPTKVSNLPTIVSISAGMFFALALDEHGQVHSLGSNQHGQLGQGDNSCRETFTQIKNLPHIEAISAGTRHGVLLDDNNNVWVFGHNHCGELGLNDNFSKQSPVKNPFLQNIKAISAGGAHTLALDESGLVWAFGNNAQGQLGVKPHKPHKVPLSISWLPTTMAISAGGNHSIILDCEGEVWVLGLNHCYAYNLVPPNNYQTHLRLKNIPKITQISAGSEHSLLLDIEGTVWGLGANNYGALGFSKEDFCSTFNSGNIPSPNAAIKLKNLPIIYTIHAGSENSVFVDENSDIWLCGKIVNNKYPDERPPVLLQDLATQAFTPMPENKPHQHIKSTFSSLPLN